MSDTHSAETTGAALASPLPSIAATQAAQIPDKPPRISKNIRQVVDLLVSGECKTQKLASERVGIDPSYLCRELKKPQVRVFMERRARETIAAGMMRASARLNQLVDAGSEHVSLDATKHVLALAGIKPSPDTQVSVNIELKAGYVIDLSEQPRRVDVLGKNVGHGPSTIDQAQVIDNAEVGQ